MRHQDRLSPAVQTAIATTEQQSEILISLFQAGFVLFVGLLYFLAPKGYEGSVPIRPVPLVLIAYSPFVLGRLILALKRRLTPLLLGISIIVDITMICVLLWTYHVQYQQPAGFYLKAPTAMYLFIFIALRSLRYDARYVGMAGIAAAAGWLVLTMTAIAGESGITRDFVEYMTGTDVLIGAQVDHIIALLTFTFILAAGVRRSGQILTTSATETVARQELSRYFSPDVSARILDSETGFQPGQGEVSSSIVLAIDLRGFSAWASGREPAAVMQTLADYQSRVVPIVLSHGGSIDKFMGDGILCHFGAAVRSPHPYADGLRCAEELQTELSSWRHELGSSVEAVSGTEFEFGIGVAGGQLIFGAVGDHTRLEFTVIGTPVNTAAKLEKHTKTIPAHILVPYSDLKTAVSEGYQPGVRYKRIRGRLVEGMPEPMDLAVLPRE